ncbi:hypothetical protein CKAH01_08130 [Colletotrichum kahawae]|uniref:Uncharacterized protein n=1 Tax=Colletotrichum kahawae TaxID=34407 RepID=A0AAD9Y3B5_COLKA|nr:hypothetical protein CKAH01_08130 [Colletotrichum kahawae]
MRLKKMAAGGEGNREPFPGLRVPVSSNAPLPDFELRHRAPWSCDVDHLRLAAIRLLVDSGSMDHRVSIRAHPVHSDELNTLRN